jgi:hypothetical protein
VKFPRQRPAHRPAILAAGAVGLVGLGALATYLFWHPAGPTSSPTESDGPGNAGAQVQKLTTEHSSTELSRSHVLQGRAAVRDALIDFGEPERRFGAVDRDNAVRRADQCNAFLVRFDLAKAGLPPQARVAKATVSFYVWDPSSRGKTKVCAFALKTAWDEATVSWRESAAGQAWRGSEGFAFGVDTGPAGAEVVVDPDQEGTDTLDPPMEYQLDVTELVRSWLDGGVPNHGLAIAPVIDPSVDEGFFSRFQVVGSEHSRKQYTPKLTVSVRQ